jgi:hypothetical protein
VCTHLAEIIEKNKKSQCPSTCTIESNNRDYFENVHQSAALPPPPESDTSEDEPLTEIRESQCPVVFPYKETIQRIFEKWYSRYLEERIGQGITGLIFLVFL